MFFLKEVLGPSQIELKVVKSLTFLLKLFNLKLKVMTSNHLSNLFLKISAGIGLCFTTFVAFPETIRSATCDENPSNLTSSCTKTPERYVITVYEMGLCTSDPLTGTDFDGSNCSATLTSVDGISADIAGTTAALSGGTDVRPGSAAYEYAYIKMSNSFGLRGSYQLNDTTYYSTDSGSATTSGSAENFTSTLYNFGGGSSCAGTPTYSTSESLSGGVMKARITDSSYVTSTSCGSSTRIVGSFKPTDTTLLTINDNTKGLEVQFTTTGISLTVIPDQETGTTVDSFDGGPFQPQFEKY